MSVITFWMHSEIRESPKLKEELEFTIRNTTPLIVMLTHYQDFSI